LYRQLELEVATVIVRAPRGSLEKMAAFSSTVKDLTLAVVGGACMQTTSKV
jgi:hypothetical protein